MKFVAMQAHPYDFVDEGIDNVLENMKRRAGVNAVVPIVNMIDEQHPPSGIFPHNPRRQTYTSRGGYVYFRPQMNHYRNSGLRPLRTDEVFLRDFDVLNDVIARSRDYGMKYFAWIVCFEDAIHATKHPKCLRVDIRGKPDSTAKLCMNNPMARRYYLGLIEDIVANHDVDGVFLDRLRYFRPDETTDVFSCFCRECMKKAGETGYNVKRLKKSAEQASKMLSSLNNEDVGVFSKLHYGIFDVLKRIVEVRGILDLVKFRAETVAGFIKEARDTVRDSGEKVQISMNTQPPSYSWLLGQDYRSIGEYLDWVKVMAYPQMRGKMVTNILRSKILGNLNAERIEAESLSAIYALLGITGPLRINEAERGLSAEYITTELLRARYELGAGKSVYAGSQIYAATPDEVKAQIGAAKDGKADGIVYITYGYAPLENFETARELWNRQ